MSEWYATLSHWLEANPEWLGLGIFLAACLECLAVAGILIPGTVLLFALGVMAGSGALSLGETLLLAYTGGLLGDAISYGIGRRFHQGIRRLPVLRDHPEWLAGAETYFQRYGVVSLLVGRYIGPLRPMLPLVAGMLDMPFVRFVLVSMLAAAGWAVAYMLPGWATGAALRLPLPEGFWSAAGMVAAAIALMLLVVIHSSLREQRWATAVAAGISGSLLLLATSNAAFSRLVPWLLLVATSLFAFSGQISRAVAAAKAKVGLGTRAAGTPGGLGGLIFQTIVAIYGGFFGAGMGILTLAALAIQGVDDMQELNGLKNLTSAVNYTVAAATFIIAGAISWPHTLLMIATAMAGAFAGAAFARRLPAIWLRRLVVAVGGVLSLIYFIKTYA